MRIRCRSGTERRSRRASPTNYSLRSTRRWDAWPRSTPGSPIIPILKTRFFRRLQLSRRKWIGSWRSNITLMTSTFLTRIRLKNYKSIATCDVRLGPLRFLVGPNGAGKSNFLDAMRFVTESLRTSLDHAMRDRGGIGEVRRRSAGHPTHFETTLYFQLPGGESGEYGFRIGALPEGGFEIQYEICKVHPPDPLAPTHHFIVEKGVVRDSSQTGPNATKDR